MVALREHHALLAEPDAFRGGAIEFPESTSADEAYWTQDTFGATSGVNYAYTSSSCAPSSSPATSEAAWWRGRGFRG